MSGAHVTPLPGDKQAGFKILSCARASLLMGEHAGSLMAVTVVFEKRAT